MFSILIPIYNVDITSLVSDLDRQAGRIDMPVEIICLDDHSDEVWKKINAPIRKIRRVEYQELPNNLGRSKIRNLLASKAQYPMLLFLDSDSKIIRQDFLLKYTEAYDRNAIMVGGRIYPSHCPGGDYRLHWKYGSLIEQKALSGFQSNNFLIPASIFKANPFDESLIGYGHEDTLFGHQLSLAGVSIYRIDNPVQHDRLERNLDFLQNQTNAIKNLIRLNVDHPEIDTNLTFVVKKLDKYQLTGLVARIFEWTKDPIVRNLTGKNPALNFLHFFKIAIYLKEREVAQKRKETILR